LFFISDEETEDINTFELIECSRGEEGIGMWTVFIPGLRIQKHIRLGISSPDHK
jgi:hypothetical protein